MVIVAQLVRALVCGTRGRGFEPRLSPIKSKSRFQMKPTFLFILFFLLFFLAAQSLLQVLLSPLNLSAAHFSVSIYFFHQALQYFSGAAFNKMRCTIGKHLLCTLCPFYRSRELHNQVFLYLCRI